MQILMNYEHIGTVIRIAILACVGFPVLWIASNFIRKKFEEKLSQHVATLASNTTFYLGLIFLIISILNDLGFNLSALLGAAGIAGIAIGFAAQTTVSNVISGIFLLLERSFEIGDVVTCNGSIGTVESIDLLSVKLRTFDNQLIRVPNEMFIKNSVINRSFYPVRRLDMKVSVRHEADTQQVIDLLREIVALNSGVQKDPQPLIAIADVSSWATAILCRVWLAQDNYSSTQRALVAEIKQRMDALGIQVSIS